MTEIWELDQCFVEERGLYKSNGFKESKATGPSLPNTIDPCGQAEANIKEISGDWVLPFLPAQSSCLPGPQFRWSWATIS